MFDKIIGNEQVKTVFRRLLASDRLPNSLLFVGESGIGKKPFALELAKAFVCRNPIEFEACDKCASCLRADTFSIPKPDDKNKDEFKKVFFSGHPDVGTIVAYKNSILIDAVRSLESESNFRPYEARARFFIVDEAEKMNDSAANALLKTLEEPSSTSHIFLITSRPNSLLQTIRSRCQNVRFAPIDAAEIETYLVKNKQFTSDDAKLLARLSKGSLGRALNLDLGKFREQRESIMKVVENLIVRGNRSTLLRVGEEMNDAKNKDSYNDYLDILQTVIHDIWTLNVNDASRNIVNSDLVDQVLKLSQAADRDRLAAWLKDIEILRANFTVNLNKKIATDGLFMKMASA